MMRHIYADIIDLTLITGPPNGPVSFACCRLSASFAGRRARGQSAAARPGAWPVRRPTLHSGQYGYVPLGRHLVLYSVPAAFCHDSNPCIFNNNNYNK